MTETMKDMVLLVTGAASGIGRAVAREAVAQGVRRLFVTDRNQAGLAALARDLDAGVQVEQGVADLANPAAPSRVVAAARAAFGRVDSLVNAAGVTTRASFADGTSEVFDSVFAVNARAPFLLMQEVIADMKARGAGGTIVNIQSINAHCGAPDLAIYSASKGALQTLTKNAAHAHLRDGIRVNGVNLGWVLTEVEHDMQANILGGGEDWAARAGARLPLGRLVSAQEAARGTVHLLSPASFPMTGVNVDLEQSVTGAPCESVPPGT